jgi:hypothetical protein
MDLSQKAKKIILKLLELAVLAYSVYYMALSAQKPDIFIIILIYLVFFGLYIFDIIYIGNKQEKMASLIKYFYQQNNFIEADDVRITIHKKLNDKSYRQYVDFYPQGTKKGTKYSTTKGLVKFIFENQGKDFSESFANQEIKIETLIAKYNFNKEEATKQVEDAEMSYYCTSIINDGKLWGVVYCSSKNPNTFPSQENLDLSEISRNSKILVKMIENEIN